jgi:hypothetical protein
MINQRDPGEEAHPGNDKGKMAQMLTHWLRRKGFHDVIGSVIGADAAVTGDVLADGVWAGNPAREARPLSTSQMGAQA